MPAPALPDLPSPDLLCIGAMKAGTTWLHVNLGAHPGVWLSPLKEIRYLNVVHIPGAHRETDTAHRLALVTARLDRLRAHPGPPSAARRRLIACLERMATPPFDDEWYRAIFGFRGAGQVAGDVSPQYAVLPEAGIRHALALNPALKVVALLREPAERALSHMAMHAGREPDAAALRRILTGPRWPLYAAQSDYAEWLGRWRDLLPPGALHVETMGRIRREPLAVLERLCRLLGLPFDPAAFAAAAEPVYASRADRGRFAAVLPEVREALAPRIAAFRAAWPDLAAELAETG
jgi:hypothetical protein